MKVVNKIRNNSGNGHQCVYCGESYRKQDFNVCPFCGGDGGGIMSKSWKPNKHQKKEYAKKFNEN